MGAQMGCRHHKPWVNPLCHNIVKEITSRVQNCVSTANTGAQWVQPSTVRDRQMTSNPLVHSPNASDGPDGQSWEAGTDSRSPTRVAGTQPLEALLAIS